MRTNLAVTSIPPSAAIQGTRLRNAAAIMAASFNNEVVFTNDSHDEQTADINNGFDTGAQCHEI